MSGEATDVAAITAQLWERFRPLVRERVQVLRSWADGDADVSREDAARAAHNLAGSLGSYGRSQGSAVARRADVALAGDEPGEVVRPLVRELVLELERAVEQ
ncbi:MAG: Hpt domain-containing protein [Motilibacteraceae bacterium]